MALGARVKMGPRAQRIRTRRCKSVGTPFGATPDFLVSFMNWRKRNRSWKSVDDLPTRAMVMCGVWWCAVVCVVWYQLAGHVIVIELISELQHVAWPGLAPPINTEDTRGLQSHSPLTSPLSTLLTRISSRSGLTGWCWVWCPSHWHYWVSCSLHTDSLQSLHRTVLSMKARLPGERGEMPPVLGWWVVVVVVVVGASPAPGPARPQVRGTVGKKSI